MAKIETLPGRDCGACNICCTVKPISSGGLVKAPGVTCEHCTAQGCAIYETRYDICIGYLCGWKWAPFIPADMRPDMTGLLFDVDQNPTPDGYIGEVTILAFRDGADFAKGKTVDLIASLVGRGVLVQLARPGPAGMLNAKTRINQSFEPIVRAGDLDGFLRELKAVVKALDNHQWEPFLPPDRRGGVQPAL